MQYLRSRCILASAVLAVAATALVGSSAEAAGCSGSSGVTEVVQFPDHTVIACAPGDPSSGFDALSAAGFTFTRVGRYPQALCQIDGFPADQTCVAMPPADAYWAYFHATRGGSWQYSDVGPDYDPPAGSVEGWRFGSGSAPTTRPAVAAATPTPRPSPVPTHRPTPSVASPVVRGTAAPTSPTARASSPTASASATPTRPAARVTASPTATATGSAAGTAPSAPLRATAARTSASGSGLSWVIGVVLLLVLGAGGAWVSVRRRG